jgi:hypothetical protein
MTPDEQIELDQLKQKLRQTEALLEQEKGKRIAVERDSYEVKRAAKLATDQAKALEGETNASLQEAAEQMKIALCVSQGIYAMANMLRSYTARKVSAARIVFRETHSCILMQQVIDAVAKGDQMALNVGLDKMKALIKTVKDDGERARLSAVEACMAYGFKNFDHFWQQMVESENTVHGIEETK